MTKGGSIPSLPSWPVRVLLAVMWFALLAWGYSYRMSYDLRIAVPLWTLAAMGTAGLGYGLWTNGQAILRAETWKGRWPYLRKVLGLGIAAAILAGSPISGILLGCNGALRSSEPFIVDGIITDKYTVGNRSVSHLVVVHQEQPRRYLRFSLDREVYQQTKVGDHYHEEFQIGLFGWPCRPR